MASANKQVICEELMRLAAQDWDVLVLCSDSRGSGSLTDFAKAFPRQFVEVGIAGKSPMWWRRAAFWPAAVWSRSR